MASMTEHEGQLLKTLCARIVEEKDPAVLVNLLVELDALLDALKVAQSSGKAHGV